MGYPSPSALTSLLPETFLIVSRKSPLNEDALQTNNRRQGRVHPHRLSGFIRFKVLRDLSGPRQHFRGQAPKYRLG